jgi:hypothetical protein
MAHHTGDGSCTFRLWAGGCSHVTTDLSHGRRSLADAITDSERGGDQGGPAFDWDIMLHLGDLKGDQNTPDDRDGELVLEQFAAAEKHRREHFYNLLGNHDASGPDEPTQWWFRRWIDPTGENTAVSGVDNLRRLFPATGTWERYSFQAGNLLFLMMGDRNDGGPPAGRRSRGGYPAGRVTSDTFQWWRQMVEGNPDSIIVSCHHHMLEDTTVASGLNQGVDGGYHGSFADGAPEGASFIYFLDDRPHARAFESYLEAHPRAIDLWLGGHTHARPDDTYGGRGHIQRKWGVGFINCAAITRHHAGKAPMSRLLTFTEGSAEVRVQCYLHTGDFAPEGWYHPAERALPLSRPFTWE